MRRRPRSARARPGLLATWADGTAASAANGKGISRERDRDGRHVVPRPSSSPALVALGVVWAWMALANDALLDAHFTTFSGGGLRGASLSLLAASVVAALALCVAGACVRAIRPLMLTAALAGVVGVVACSLAATQSLARADDIVTRPASSLRFVVETDPKLGDYGSWTFQASVRSEQGERLGRVWVGASQEAFDRARPRMGSVVTAVGRWSSFEDDEWGRSMLSRGVVARLSASRLEPSGAQPGPVGAIRSLRARVGEAMTGSVEVSAGVALTCGVVLGDTSSLEGTQVSEDFRNLGLTHLVAVSGSHLAVVAGILGALLKAVKLRPVPRCFVLLMGLAAYVVLSGVQPSAVRSFAMVVIALLAPIASRRAHGISSLSVAALALVLLSPSMAFEMGFELSVLSVLGIAAFSRYASCWVRCALPTRVPRAISEAIGLALVAQAFTLPVTLPAFGILPVLSPLANVVVGPLMSAQLVLGMASALACAISPASASVALAPCAALGQAICDVSSLMAGLPYAAVPCSIGSVPAMVALVCLCAAVYLVWPAPSRRAGCILACGCGCLLALAFVRVRYLGPDRVVVLDVGQGDAILVQSGAHAVLVDTGPDDAVVSALGRARVIHLDAVLLTHTDLDHVGGLDSLRGIVRVDSVIVARGVLDAIVSESPELLATILDVARTDVRQVVAGDKVEVGRACLDVIWPRATVEGGENRDSIVSVASFGAGAEDALRVLLTGDAEQDVTQPLAEAGSIGDVDVLKVGHHGSAVSTSAGLLAAVSPELAVASAGVDNRYGHPTGQCRETLARAGVPLLCTIWSGDVTLAVTGSGYEVRCQRGDLIEGVMRALPP